MLRALIYQSRITNILDNLLLKHATLAIPESGVKEWWGNDNSNTFQELKKSMPADWKYHTMDIQYQVNTQGYRTSEFTDIDWHNSWVILGCSVIFGLGVAESETVSSLLEKQINQPVVNLGISGSGCDWQYWNAIKLYNAGIRPKKLIMHWPNPCRGMFINEHGHGDTFINTHLNFPPKPVYISDICDLNMVYAEEHHWYAMLELYATHLTELFGDSIQHVYRQCNLDTLKKYNVPGFNFEAELLVKNQVRVAKRTVTNLARDGMHPGGDINSEIIVPSLMK